MAAGSRRAQGVEVVRKVRQVLGAVLGDEHEVLEPAAAEALAVEARLERDHVAGDELAGRRGRGSAASCTSSPTPWPSAVEEAVLEHLARLLREQRRLAVLLEDVADSLKTSCPARRASPPRATVERLLARACGTRRSSSEGVPTTNVRVMSAKQPDSRSRGQRSITTGSSGAIGAGAHVVADGGLGAVRDDELVRDDAVRGERLADRELDPLAGQRLAVDASGSPFGARRARSRSRAASIPASAARWARRIPASSASFFTRRRRTKYSRSGVSVDPVRAQVVGDVRREGRRARPPPRCRTPRHARIDVLPARSPRAAAPARAARRSRTPRQRVRLDAHGLAMRSISNERRGRRAACRPRSA